MIRGQGAVVSKETERRDSSIERLLPRALEAHSASVQGDACLDADTLAAWTDDALTEAERKAVEAHAADCARCQALLAAMIATNPEPARKAPRAWRPSLGWLIPLTAAAAAALVWITVPQRPSLRQQSQPADVAEATGPPASASASAPAATPSSASSSAAESASASADLKAERAAVPQVTGTRQSSAAAQSPEGPSANQANAEAAVPAPPIAPPVIAGAPAAGDTSTEAKTAAPSRPSASQTPTVAESTSARAAHAPLRTEAHAFLGAAMPVIVSSNPASRWRIVNGGAVQRTSDGGSTWQTQQTGVNETLAAGSSPSPSVCWLVGPRGIVLLSTDDRSWRRVAFPEEADLASVSAADAQTATVTTADGRTFTTSDGGRTWARP